MKKILPILLSIFLVVIHTTMHGSLRRHEKEALQAIKKRVDERNAQASSQMPDTTSRVAKSTVAVSATHTAFGGPNRFFLAGAPASAANQTLSVAQLFLNPDATTAVNLIPLALATPVTVNGVVATQSPFTGVMIDTLTLAGNDKMPVITTMLPEPNATDQTIMYPHVYLVAQDDGKKIITNTLDYQAFSGFLVDAQPEPHKVVGPPLAIAATGSDDGNFIIAAVPQAATTWDGKDIVGVTTPSTKPAFDGRGIALLGIKNDFMEQQLDIVKIDTFPGSFPISGLAGSDVIQASDRVLLLDKGPIAFFAPKDSNTTARVVLGNKVDMCWDPTLERLYIGLSDVSRGDVNGNPNSAPNTSTGVCQVLVAKLLTLEGQVLPGEGEIGTEGIGGESGENSVETGTFEVIGLKVEPVIKNVSSYIFPDVLTSDNGKTLGDTLVHDENFASKHILGFYRTTAQNTASDKLFATVNKVRTMHTSTGKSYLIINGGVAPSIDGLTPPVSLNAQMYAVPLVDKGPDDDATGFVARSDDLSKVIDLQPIVDQAMSNEIGDQEKASTDIYNLYNQPGNIDTYSVPGTDVSDVTNQATFRTFVKNAMPYTSNSAQRIGGIEDPAVFNQLLSFDGSANITDVQVYGDTVYVGVASVRDVDHLGEAGIFASTALFTSTGEIRAWTPWQRVMGSTDGAYGIGFDGTSSNYWYFTTPDGVVADGTAPSQVNVTQWGPGDPTLHGGSSTDNSELLSSVLANPVIPSTLVSDTGNPIPNTFLSSNGGVFGLFNFGPDTPGFKPRIPGDVDTPSNRHEQFGMMVATGNGQIAIIETGSLERGGAGVFQPTIAFTPFTYGTNLPTNLTLDLNATVYLFAYNSPDDRGTALQDLGIITAAEVSRFPAAAGNENKGWLFVGGDTGVAVLVKDYAGNGWPTGEGEGIDRLLPGDQLTGIGSGSDDFPGGLQWFFVRLMQKVPATATTPESSVNVFNNVRKLVSDGDKYLYVLTATALFRIEMTRTNFAGDVNYSSLEVRIDPANIVTIATMTDSTLLGSLPRASIGDATDQMFDMMVIQRDKTVGHEKSTLILATSKGLFSCNQSTDAPQAVSALLWQPVKTVSESVLGPALSLEFFSTQRGQTMVATVNESGATILSAEGNVGVRAFDGTLSYLAQYRFNVSGGNITSFEEVYNTDYFYKIGTLNDPGNTRSNQLLVNYPLYARSANFPFSGTNFSTRIPVVPNPANFLKNTTPPEALNDSHLEFRPIDLGIPIKLPIPGGKYVRNEASGAVYIGGQFGVRVNE